MLLNLAITAVFILLLMAGYGFYFFKSLVTDTQPLLENIQKMSQQSQTPNTNPAEKWVKPIVLQELFSTVFWLLV